MEHYDPLEAPDSDEWLDLDESERITLVEEYHRNAGIHIEGMRTHAVVHVIIENQLAEDIPQVLVTLRRLMKKGLDRHEAIHAIGTVVAKHIHAAMTGNATADEGHLPYLRDLKKLKARDFL